MKNSYLKVFVDWRERYQKLSDAEFGRLMRAAIAYKGGNPVPELTGREELMWDGIKLDIDRDNEQYSAICEARSEAGRRGAETRWNGKSNLPDSKNSKSHLPYGKNSQDKEKDKEEDKDKDKDIYKTSSSTDDRFEKFWEAYPRKVGKGNARTAWAKIRVTDELFNTILNAVEQQKQWDQWQRDNGQYIPHPATWLNQQRWEDSGIVVARQKSKYDKVRIN